MYYRSEAADVFGSVPYGMLKVQRQWYCPNIMNASTPCQSRLLRVGGYFDVLCQPLLFYKSWGHPLRIEVSFSASQTHVDNQILIMFAKYPVAVVALLGSVLIQAIPSVESAERLRPEDVCRSCADSTLFDASLATKIH